ncbi:MAG: 16S rRNA G1207 methylase RsmC [Alcanivorax sp.]|jgi:16S rRNA G1207 methylase RsmC
MPDKGANFEYQSPLGSILLRRYPSRKNELLQAWTSADTLLLHEYLNLGALPQWSLVVNDEHGALSVAVEPAACWTDSWLSSKAIADNLTLNNRAPVPVLWSTQTPPSSIQTVLLRVPKQLSYFEYQLAKLSQILPEGATLLAAGMDKHLSPHTAEIIETYIGPTKRHRGQSRARLFSAINKSETAANCATQFKYHCGELEAELSSLPNVFSGQSLDMGTRFLFDYLPQLKPAETLVDLACGNGVIGLVAGKLGISRHGIFCDESAMAVESARLNLKACPDTGLEEVTFLHGDGLLALTQAPELILCNPPFHLQHTVDEFAGVRLLQQCAHALPTGGRLCLVANRHLNYLEPLRRQFKQVEMAAENRKFRIYLATQN